MKKKKLEILLQSLRGFVNPKIELEQYITPAPIAAEILTIALLKGDISDRTIYDLGCGTGILGIGAALLGAKEVIMVEADAEALEIARQNAEKFSLGNLKFIEAEVKEIAGKGDTVLMNPPFGVHRRGADIEFLDKALEIAPVVYTMHKSETREFVLRHLKSRGVAEAEILPVKFILPRTYSFHEKEKKAVSVDIYRIRRN